MGYIGNYKNFLLQNIKVGQAPLAQWIRASRYGREGQRFESFTGFYENHGEIMKKILYILAFFITSCIFWSPPMPKYYIKDAWKFFKDDSTNNVVVYNMLKYDEEKDISTIKLKFINKNNWIYVSVKYALNIIYYEDEKSEFYRKKKKSILGSSRTEDKKFHIKLQPYGFAIITATMDSIRIRQISFYSYETKKSNE